MAPRAAEIHIKGQAELEAAFLQLRRDVLIGMKAELLRAGKAVSDESHRLIPGEASNVIGPWSEFKVGATVKGVYVQNKARRRGGSPRKNLASAILGSMESALDRKKVQVEAEFAALVDGASLKAGL